MKNDYLKKLKIGNVELNNNVILGPMAGYTDLPFRVICEKYNPGLTFTEMVSSKAIMYNDENTMKLLDISKDKKPISIQVFGSDLDSIKYSVEFLNKNIKPDLIDINSGCPAPKIVKNGDGSKLLLDIEKLGKIVKIAVENSNIPITVKIRKGWNNENIVAVEAAKIIEENGASMITIHGRTKQEYYSGKCDLEIIKKVKENVNIPVIGNGDITSPEKAKEMFEITGCDGIMISRGSLGNPWIFKQVQDYLENGKYSMMSDEDIGKTILEHISLKVNQDGEYKAMREMRKHICSYIRLKPNSSEIRKLINTLETENQVKDVISKYYNLK